MAESVRIQLRGSGMEKKMVDPVVPLRIGRNPGCDIFLPDARISRVHAEIRVRQGQLYLVALSSSNGTWLNGKLLIPDQEYLLNAGDIIDLAHAKKLMVSEKWIATGADAPSEDTVSLEDIIVACNQASIDWELSEITEPEFEDCPIEIPPAPPSPSYGYNPPPPCAPNMVPPPPPAPCCAPAPMAAPSRAPAPVAAPTAKKKGGFLSSLFGKKKEVSSVPAEEPAPQPVTADDVQFRGTAPDTIHPGEYFPVKIMMYREDDYQRADRESASVADKTRSTSSSVFQARRDQQFRISLQSPDLPLDCESQSLRWNGKFAVADFDVYLPEDYQKRQLRLHGRVYSGDAVLTDLKLILQIGALQPADISCEKVRLRSAFISYASADRAKVVARIQGIQLACPDMDLFFDVESLRRGENWESRLYREISARDLFYLFWSKNAAASDWVQRELAFALTEKTVDYIEPIPLEGPEFCPPPESLMGKHFNDWTLRYLNNQ